MCCLGQNWLISALFGLKNHCIVALLCAFSNQTQHFAIGDYVRISCFFSKIILEMQDNSDLTFPLNDPNLPEQTTLIKQSFFKIGSG